MKFGKLSKVGMAVLGAFFALNGAMYLVILKIGTFSEGRTAFIASAIAFLVLSVPCFAFLYSRRLAKVLGLVVLLAFALSMLWLVFLPSNPAPNPTTSQIAAIALCVLLLARLELRWRRGGGPTDSA